MNARHAKHIPEGSARFDEHVFNIMNNERLSPETSLANCTRILADIAEAEAAAAGIYEQAMNMLRDTDASVVSVAAALGYASQTAFAAAFRRLAGETPSNWRRRVR